MKSTNIRPGTRAALATCCLALLAACSQPDEGAAQAPPAERNVSADDVLALVNGKPVSRHQASRHAAQRSSGDEPPDPDQIVQELVNLELLGQEAVRRGLDRKYDVVEEVVRQRNAVLANELVQSTVAAMEISEADLRAEYETQVATLPDKEYRARHILVEQEAQAVEIIEALAAGGDFIALAEERSVGPSKVDGGDLGWFNRDQMVPPFAEAVRGMRVGATSEAPVRTRFGWHVIRLEETRDFAKPAFDDVREQLRGLVTNNRLREMIDNLRAAAEIEIK